MEGTTSSGISSLTKPVISTARKIAQADKVKAVKVKMKVGVKIKKKMGGGSDA